MATMIRTIIVSLYTASVIGSRSTHHHLAGHGNGRSWSSGPPRLFGLGCAVSAAIVTILLLDPLFSLLFFLDARLLDLLDLESVEEEVEVRRIIWLGGPNP